MEESGVKTIICSVLFLDIVEYSKKTVSGQIALKEGFNAFLAIAIRDVPTDDRIILDTGDGAVISFLGDVEAALKAALIMRASLLSADKQPEPPLLVRMGINLGPVRLVKDINGLPNIVGDGINVAQRVMGFAAPGQILVSQSYFDAVSRLSQEYAGMFHYEGARTDKHVRAHEVYAIGYPGEFTVTQKNRVLGSRAKYSPRWLLARMGKFGRVVENWLLFLSATYKNASAPVRALIIGVLVIMPILLIVLIVEITPRPAVSESQVTVMPAQNVVAAQSSVTGSVASANKSTPSADETSRLLQAKQKKARVNTARVRTLEETMAVNVGAPGLVSLAVTPWGEIYLDGRMQGVSPPLAELQVLPGEHEIEIRNTTFPAYRQKFRVQASERIKIKHKFGR